MINRFFFLPSLTLMAASQIAYFSFSLVVRTAAALTKYLLLHAVCLQMGTYYFVITLHLEL